MKDNRLRVRGVHGAKLFRQIISTSNLFAAWREFKMGKTSKRDVLSFAEEAERNIVELHELLVRDIYRHGAYRRFFVHDPKRRPIAKASVRDRVLHHAICRILAPHLDKSFIFDSYASRGDKGTHAANKRLNEFARRLSQNNTRTVWFLKCDIRKFFDSVNHDILMALCRAKIADTSMLTLLEVVIRSFETRPRHGIPLGNLTSQLFANMYLDPLDQYVKRTLRFRHYIRYMDDFIFLAPNREELEQMLVPVTRFLRERLTLEVHPNKITRTQWQKGIDFLGYVHFPHHKVVRTKTVRRMFRKLFGKFREVQLGNLDADHLEQAKQSYLGVLSHARSKRISKSVRHQFRAPHQS